MVLVEARSVLQLVFRHVQNQVLVLIVPLHRESMPRHGKQLVADSKKPTKIQGHIEDFAGIHIDDQILDRSDVFARGISNMHCFNRTHPGVMHRINTLCEILCWHLIHRASSCRE